MPNLSLATGLSSGVSISGANRRECDTVIDLDYSPEAGQAGTLSTRTDDDEGTLTLGAGHTVTTGATIDIYWATGMRYGVTVGTVSGTSVPFSGGAGDNLPIATTAVFACIQTAKDVDVVGNNIQLFALSSAYRASIDFLASGGTVLLHVEIPAGESREWYADSIHTNPLAGVTVASVVVTSGTATAANVKGVIGYNG